MPVQEGLKAWRARLLQWLTVGICYGGWLVGVPSVVLALYEQLWPLVVADLLAMLWVAHLHLRSRASYRGKVLQLLALLYLLGVVLLLTIGYVSQVYLVALPVLAVLLLSPRVALAALALNGVTLLACGVLIQVEQEHAHLGLIAFGLAYGVGNAVVQQAPIGQARQGIVHGVVGQ